MAEAKPGYRQYNPYNDDELIKVFYNLPTSPEILFPPKSPYSWTRHLQLYIGGSYLTGAAGGYFYGVSEGLRAADSGDSLKIRLSRILNSGTSHGQKVGNACGVVALIFSGIEGGLVHFRIREDNWVTTVAAGSGTGAVYKAAKGPRAAAIAAAVGGLGGGVVAVGKQVVKKIVV